MAESRCNARFSDLFTIRVSLIITKTWLLLPNLCTNVVQVRTLVLLEWLDCMKIQYLAIFIYYCTTSSTVQVHARSTFHGTYRTYDYRTVLRVLCN
jgi:hypothetical protein